MSKVVFIDWGIFLFQSVFINLKVKHSPANWLALRSIIACLKAIELYPEDIIIVAVDSELGSWRKNVDPNYKANRAGLRLAIPINWDVTFRDFDRTLDNLSHASPFHIIKIDKLEADDIIAYGCRFFADRDVIVVSNDSDFEQLEQFPNVKNFSPKTKKFKIVKSPEKIVAKKVIKEKTDNLVSPILNNADFEKRFKIVNLCKLPKEVEELIEARLQYIVDKGKTYDDTNFIFPKMRVDLKKIYDNEKCVQYVDSFKKKRTRKPLVYQSLEL